MAEKTASYQVIARAWRPQVFEDVVGQKHVTDTLSNAITGNRVAHAYLLVGPRGVGKTTTARIFAKALNCRQGMSPSPCNECESCVAIMAGNDLDVQEIDGASNNSVDDVRALRENIRVAPNASRFRIFIIDEVHMLSTAAFNALLKTLEEPPPHVKFIFATTEAHKVPATILSRCQRFDLRRISTQDIVGRLEMICAAEKIETDAPALLAVARGAQGGMRDAQSALDQLIAFRGKTIREEDVLSVFGLVAWAQLDAMAQAVLGGDAATALKLVADLDQAGKDTQRTTEELLGFFRNLLVWQHGGQEIVAGEVSAAERESLAASADRLAPEQVHRIVDILLDTEARMRATLSRRVLLEVALVRACRAVQVVPVDTIVAQIADLRQRLGGVTGGAPAAPPAPSPAAAPSPPPRPAPPPAPPAPRADDPRRHPAVKLATELFSGTIRDVRPHGRDDGPTQE